MRFIVSEKRFYLFLTISVFLFASLCFSQEAGKASPQDVIKQYRKVLRTAADPAKIAEAHYKIGFALEELGRETEATAEYLKVIINYPGVKSASRMAEDGLGRLYSGFSERSRELAGEYKIEEAQKDPTIFFAYVKSLYENYRNLGQYKRALHVLQKLYDMDPENESYLIDMGEIYLNGYNNPDKAILHFRKALEINPYSIKAYVDVGRAYEKKGDYEIAVKEYAAAAEISPASPWAIYGLRRTDGIRLAENKRLVKDWYFLGPFDNSDNEGLQREFPPEVKIDLGTTYTGKDDLSIKWFRPFGYDSSGYVDLNMLFSPNDFAVAYALTYINSQREREVQLGFGAEDGVKVWLNDKEIFSYSVSTPALVDDDMITAKLKKGWNKVLLKISDTWGSWGFYFRATDLKGNPLEDLVFDPLRDNERLKHIYGKLKRERRFRITKIAAMYTAAVSALLFGLYFMISNICNKIKIKRMKEDFISSVSHELKTPIAAVKMLAETLRRGKVKEPSKVDQYYGMIIKESDRLTRFINKILDFARIEKGGKVFYFETSNVADLAKTAVDTYKDEAQDRDLEIRANTEKSEIFAEIDKDAVLQIILNLIDNGYKYSGREKDITVNVKEAGGDVRIEVIDKGLGIPKPDIERIFDKFYRSQRDMIKGVKGSGLGLSFVKHVIDSHGGRIAVESEVGKGTKFIISLPVKKT
ncbi:MAG: ATP-binding protein [Candidatus Omnitrophota bacterium]